MATRSPSPPAPEPRAYHHGNLREALIEAAVELIERDGLDKLSVREAAKRGLSWFDDGSTPRSVAQTLSAGQSLPFARADFAIDAVPTSAEIDRALVKLETIAKERGTAVGVASALPVSIERLGAWLKTLDSKGIMLVPLTTAMLKSKSG